MVYRAYQGWVGKLLRVDLTRRICKVEPIDPYLGFIGGRGISDWIVFQEMNPATKAMDPESVVAVGTGPLAGTLAPGACRMNVSSKSVATGGISTANAGGHLAAEMKFAGFDQIVIQGRAEEPVYLFLRDGQAEIKDARPLWGKTTWETEEMIRRNHHDGEIRVASIGPAGENLCAQACLIVDKARAAGWGGCGAVFGSKNLKAIAVRGKRPIRLADPEAFWAYCKSLLQRISRSRASGILTRYGTHGAYGVGGVDGKTPQGVRNHRDEYWPADKGMYLREVVFRERWEIGRTACFSCPTSCTHLYHLPGGKYGPLTVEGIHTNTVRALGSNLDVTDAEAVLRGQTLVNQLGLNTDGVGSILGWAFEAFERGLLTKADTDGLELIWGNGDAMVQLIEQIAYRRGIGDLLARGVKEAAQVTGKGSEKFAMQVKGQEMNEQSVRSHKGWALGIFTSTRGAGHLSGASLVERLGMDQEKARELFGTEAVTRPEAYEGKGAATAWFESFKAVVDSMGLCYYMTAWIDMDLLGLEEMASLFHKATGRKTSADELFKIGERIYNIEKAFNTLHAGFTREDDLPPERFLELPISGGPFAGAKIDLESYNRMLDEYYRAHGWDPATSWQTVSCLDRLGLDEVKKRLAQAEQLIL
jgi:aldehyde:ferredoxin oxidoreductase